MAGEPISTDPLVSALLSDQAKRTAQARADAQLTPEQRRLKRIEERINRRAYGGHTSFQDAEAQRRIMKARASRETRNTQIARGQATLVGQAPPRPESSEKPDDTPR